MEPEEILRNIFGPNVLVQQDTSSSSDIEKKSLYERQSYCLILANNYIKNVLRKDNENSDTADSQDGRIGPKIVRFDISTHHGLFIVSPDRLSISSQSNFSTMRANTGLYRGKWIYELQLGSKGVMQVGWGTIKCEFNQESGVGDTVNSYAYDGNRIRKWNVTTHKYGEPWLSGDIIGCALDVDNGKIEFYRNGRSLGTAFENITMGAGIAYFPTVSLAYTENLTANFGSTPLRYPVKEYQTLQAPPTLELKKAKLLFEWFFNLIPLIEENKSNENNEEMEEKSMSNQAFLMCLARSVLQHIGPLLAMPYITEAIFIPFVERLSNSGSDRPQNNSKLITCLDLLWTFLEEHEIKACFDSAVVYLLSAFRHVSLLLEYPDQSKSLILLINLCQHTATRQNMLKYILFDKVRLANFVHIKPLDEGGLADIVNKTWWETDPVDPSVEVNKQAYMDTCERIKSAITEIEALQVELIVTLLDNKDGTEKTPTSRTIFLKKFRRFVQENLISNRTMPILQTPLPITLCCFHRLLVAFRVLWDAEVGTSPVYVPCRAFYDASINYSGIDRLGGVLSHLNKTYRNELIHLLGPEHDVIVAMDQAQDTTSTFMGGPTRLGDLPVVIPAFARMVNVNPSSPAGPLILERLGYFPFNREDRSPMRNGPADAAISLLEMLDGIILFYHATAKKQLAKVASLRDSMSEYMAAMNDVKVRWEQAKKSKDPEALPIQEELGRTISVFNIKLSEQARYMAWIRAAVYSDEKQAQLAWLLRVVTLTLHSASQDANMFTFVPDFYLEAMTDLSVAIRNHVHPTVPIERISGYEDMLCDVAQFLCDHFFDPRIIHANARDTLILTLAGFVSNSLTLAALENVPGESRMKVVTNLLRSYENRAWAQSNWVLVRFWQGNGFGFRYEKSPHLAKKIGPKMLQQESISQPIKPCPSVKYQAHVKDALLSNPQGTKQFLNSLLNQLNWTFSEFIRMLQEIQNMSSRPERVFIESRQLKIGATCFDLTISLLRVLEMIATIANEIFSDPLRPSSENLLSRLCELLCQILNRISSQTGCFQYVVLLDIPDLETIDHFPILAAVIGILLALLQEEMRIYKLGGSKDVPKVTKVLLTEPSFQISSISFVLGEVKPSNIPIKNSKPFSFFNYKEDITEYEINKVREMIKYLDLHRTMLPDSKYMSDDENICTICYAHPIAATFKPCNHRSCRTCIDRHLSNSRECFFCKATIHKVVDAEGTTLHDFLTNYIAENATSPS
ncbi:E3 ubiquitin-protein ligase RNF123 isoform X2 [Cephus cinctus]|uniref:RING-type E3 ubiquitin transferase n=1 Tax=Cephus cinctus TaxID=211228 RepID=A0AAJ7BFK7_CEPCN|nr:E3 ubiquitin-protein ligase RNF123 isoform X2 [Cephus cinctus]